MNKGVFGSSALIVGEASNGNIDWKGIVNVGGDMTDCIESMAEGREGWRKNEVV